MDKKKKRRRKTFSRMTRGIVLFGMILVAGLFAFSAINEIVTYGRLKNEVSANRQLLEETNREKEELENTKKNLTNPDYLEFVARGKYHVSRSGEQVFVFPSLQEQEEENASSQALQDPSQPAESSDPALAQDSSAPLSEEPAAQP